MKSRTFLKLCRASVLALMASGVLASSALAAGELVAASGEIEFGFRPQGSTSSASVSVTNVGPDEVTISDVWLEGDVDPFDFADATCVPDLALAVNEDCQVSLTFTASDSMLGQREVFLVIDGAESDIPAVTRVTGASYSTYPETLVVEPSTVDFGSVALGSSSGPRTLTVRNPTTNPTTITNVVVHNPFRLVSNQCLGPLGPGAECVLSAVFNPVAPSSVPGSWTLHRLGVMAGGVTAAGSAALVGSVTGTEPSPTPLPKKIPAKDISGAARASLDRIIRAVPRLVRGGPTGRLRLPRFDIDTAGTLSLRLDIRRGKRIPLARARATVGPQNGKRLRFPLTKAGRRLLTQPAALRIRAVVRFKAAATRKVFEVSKRFVARPLPKR